MSQITSWALKSGVAGRLLAVSLASCVTLGNLLDFSVSWCSSLKDGNSDS